MLKRSGEPEERAGPEPISVVLVDARCKHQHSSGDDLDRNLGGAIDFSACMTMKLDIIC